MKERPMRKPPIKYGRNNFDPNLIIPPDAQLRHQVLIGIVIVEFYQTESDRVLKTYRYFARIKNDELKEGLELDISINQDIPNFPVAAMNLYQAFLDYVINRRDEDGISIH